MPNVTTTPLADGGFLTSYIEDVPDTAQDRLHVQKHAAGGALVGAEFVTGQQANLQPPAIQALDNGGYVVVSGWALRGYYYTASVFAPDATRFTDIDVPGSGSGFQIAASPLGGFLLRSQDIVVTPGGPDYNGNPLLTLYDDRGALAMPTAHLTGGGFSLTAQSDGRYAVSWTDGNLQHSFLLDPRSPPNLSAPAAPTILGVYDDASGTLRAANAGAVDDTTPVVRVAVNHTGFLKLSLVESSSSEDAHLLGGVTVTAADVARGYVDVTVSGSAAPSTIYAHFKSDFGVPSAAATLSLNVTGEPPITSARDDVGAVTGLVADGAVTDDATPTLHVKLAGSVAHAGDVLAIVDGAATVAQVTLTADDISRGAIDVTTGALANGAHHLQTRLPDHPPSAYSYTLDVEAPATSAGGQTLTASGPGSVLTGGAGADTLIASQGNDTLTGGQGADVFAFKSEPWAPIHITDFAVGTDKLDLSKLFQAAGYTGADPVADHYIYLVSDGAGGTLIRFDHDGGGPTPQWPNSIIDLEHVSPTGLSWAQLQGSASVPTASSSGGTSGGTTPGVALTSTSPGSKLVGGAGADTLTASQGLDTLTGGAGADVFVFAKEPWAPIHITDFTPGVDKLDLRLMLKAAGYTGTNPIADHYIYVESDGAGGSLIRFDHDGAALNQRWPNTIIDLEHVAPSQVHASDWIIG